MAHKTENRILETSATTGLGAFALTGAVPSYVSFASKMAEGDTCHYMINSVDTAGRPTGIFELGRGTFTSGALARTLVIASSAGGAKVDFPAGAKQVGLTMLAPTVEQLRKDWREALGIYNVGQCAHFAQSTPPPGWLKRNGAVVSRTTYADLFAEIGTTYNTGGEAATDFRLPDGRGVVDRGLDEGRGLDPNRVLGTFQDSDNKSHTHPLSEPPHAHGVYDPPHAHGHNDPVHAHSASTDAQGYHDHASGWNANNGGTYGLQFGSAAYSGSIAIWGADGGRRTDAAGNHGHNITVNGSGLGLAIYGAATGIGIYGNVTGITMSASGGTEARMRNTALLACIKY